ncbi:efflux RND transporter periplasmic adaptor subunit [Pseudoalteromonas aurantia]|uniref:Membrane fusion protein n=1 Tax=Pseudoalteromonas aurantia 208 TaxID=1314867 RepID=A0ABR9EB02_9GAMM|nr:efflux RND transporter periplasmic adaptor subunit [Pseudoalteromonas aurantia]MBE0368151.1 membrane fusion protein [Pseudoalteromonas aurantia 208]
MLKKSKFIKSFSLLSLSILLTACHPSAKEEVESIRPIKAMKIGSAKHIADKKFPGVARATQEVDLSFRVSGTLNDIPVKIGQEVRIGDVLAVLDKRDFEVELANAEAGLANTKAQLSNAKIEYERVIRIQETDAGAVSKSTIDARKATYDQAKASYASSTSLLNAAKDRLSYATLKAPFDGVVVQRYADNFQDISSNSSVIRIVDISKIEMDINIPENLISNLPYVKNSRVRFDSFPDLVIPATIKEVSNEASQSTRTYKVRLQMTPPDGVDILPGMSGYATGDVARPEQDTFQVVVPLSSIFSSSDSKTTFVWLYDIEMQTVKKHPVKKGTLLDQGIVIIDGLKAGDWIATAGVNYLKEGQKVRLLDNQGTKI